MGTSIATLMNRTFPQEMTEMPLWLLYKLVDRGNGKFSKPPVSPFTGEVCSKTDEGMYTDFQRALAGVEQHNADGLGFVFLHGFVAIDLDDCFKEDGTLTEMASDIADHFQGTYIEYSPSGNGLHIFCQGTKPSDRTRATGVEVYTGHNFVTVTGDKVEQSGDKVLNMQDALDWLFEKYLPTNEAPVKNELMFIDHGSKEPREWFEIGLTHDDKFFRLFNDTDHADDESGHDLALLCKLAYWLNRDSDAMLQMFFDSPWVHSKDKRHLDKVDKRSDYLERTLSRALAITTTCASDNERKQHNTSEIGLRISETKDGEIVLPLKDYTDVGNARAFAELYQEQLAFTEEWGWCFFCGLNWELNSFYQAQQSAIEFAENVMYIANKYMGKLMEDCLENGMEPNSKEGKAYLTPAVAFMKHAQRTNSESGIRAMLKLAEGMMKVPSSLFDGNPWILNTPNVVVDLRTGESYPPAWNHYNSMMCNIVYEPEPENNGMWDSFLRQIFCGDDELIQYMQMQLGAACVGKVYEERLMIANGCGSNGKSTLFNVLKAVLGDYCVSVNPDILMNKVNYEQQIAIAGIKGKRLVIGQETESGQVLSTASVKRMVSSDTMVGRVLNHGYIEFEPTHTTMLATNHLPIVKDNDEGTWRRLIVVPFNAVIDSEDMITNYQDILLTEDGPYILDWLIQGAKMFYENGCKYALPPKSVYRAGNKYRRAQREVFDQFCDDAIEFVDHVRNCSIWADPDDVYKAYLRWCEENTIKPYSKIIVSRKLGDRGMEVVRKRMPNSKVSRIWKYIKLKPEYGGLEDTVEG